MSSDTNPRLPLAVVSEPSFTSCLSAGPVIVPDLTVRDPPMPICPSLRVTPAVVDVLSNLSPV